MIPRTREEKKGNSLPQSTFSSINCATEKLFAIVIISDRKRQGQAFREEPNRYIARFMNKRVGN